MKVQGQYRGKLNTVKHLLNIERIGFRYSDILLFREYQGRLFKWKKALNADNFDLFNKKKAFHNLFIDLNPSWLEDLISEEMVVKDLTILGFKNVYSSFRDYYGFFICMYINWEIFKEKKEIKTYDWLDHPYEPVFKIIMRGGSISNSELKFVIDGQTYMKYDNNFKMPSVSENFLEFIDDVCRDFPNQEKVNQLWEEFQNNQR